MSLLESVADDLAQKVLALPGTENDNKLVDAVAEVISSSSTTLEEAFLTAVRIRRAEMRALKILARQKEAHAPPEQ